MLTTCSQHPPDLLKNLRTLGIKGDHFFDDLLRLAVRDRVVAVGVLDGKVKALLIQVRHLDDPALVAECLAVLKPHELLEVRIGQRRGLAQAAARIELIEPDIPCRCALFKEQHHSLYTRALKGTLRAIQNRMQVAGCQQLLAKGLGVAV